MRALSQRTTGASVAIDGAVVGEIERLGVTVARGRFGADMRLSLVNDGPVTIWLDTDAR